MLTKLKRGLPGTIILLCIFRICIAQSHNIFLIKRGYLHLTFDKPDGFSDMDFDNEFFYYTSNPSQNRLKVINPLNYRMISSDSSVIISFLIKTLDVSLDSSRLLQMLFPGQTANTSYLLDIRNKADTINDKVTFYSKDQSRDRYNADVAGEYGFTMEVPYLQRYPYCRIVFLHQQSLGDVEIYYFHTAGGKEKVKSLIASAECMTKYKSFTDRPKAPVFHGPIKH